MTAPLPFGHAGPVRPSQLIPTFSISLTEQKMKASLIILSSASWRTPWLPVAAEHDVSCTPAAKSLPPVDRQASACNSAAKEGAKADIIFFLMLTRPMAVVLFGDGVASGPSQGKTVVDMSSILAGWTPRNLAEKKSMRLAAITSMRRCRRRSRR
jgi:hypothetical protein